MNNYNSWFYFSISSALFFTALNLLQRKVAVESKNQRVMAVLFNLIAVLFALAIFFLTDSFKSLSFPKEPKIWIAFIVASLCYAVFERGRFVVARLLDASVFISIRNITVLVACVFSFFLYSEKMTIEKLIGGSLIIVSLCLVSFVRRKENSSPRGITIGIVISIMAGLAWALDKLGAESFNPNTYNILIWLVPLIFICFPYVRLSDIKEEFRLSNWKVILLSGLNSVGYFLQLKALSLAEATRVIPIVQTSTILTVFLGIIILKEKQDIKKKILAGVLSVAGVILLA